MEILGIDIGGTGIKGAPVNIEQGKLTGERFRVLTPHPAVPSAVADGVEEVVKHFNWHGPIGCTFPAVVKEGTVYTAANVDESWIGTNGQELFAKRTGCPVVLLNDAGAAGIAEMKFGAGRGENGLVFLITFGTGIGTALFYQGIRIPNTELGHIEVRGKDAEKRASDHVRQEKGLSWKKWATRADEYLNRLEALFSPDLFIIGGGVSKDFAKFMHKFTVRARVVPAQMLNEAGIVGAALAAHEVTQGTDTKMATTVKEAT